MDQRTRMATVLVVLAGGMTSTAALLAWMDPSWPGEPHKLTTEQLLPFARAVVSDAIVIDPARWRAIEISAALDPSWQGVALTAEPLDDVHFVIDPSGCLIRSRGWTEQRAFDAPPAAVRVQVVSSGGATVTEAQSATLSALTRAMNDVLLKGEGAVPVVTNADLAGLLASSLAHEYRPSQTRQLAGANRF